MPEQSRTKFLVLSPTLLGFIELDDWTIYRNALYLMAEKPWFTVNSPLNQPIDGYIDATLVFDNVARVVRPKIPSPFVQ